MTTSWLHRIRHLFAKDAGKVSKNTEPPAKQSDQDLCCSGKVNIAYRGVSDDRLYMAYTRHWNEVKFFRPVGLRVFCADCRRRLL